MLLGPRVAETLVKDHIDAQIEAEVKENGDRPKLPGMPEDPGRRRAIVREWPRDPKGPTITTLPAGKEAANGMPLWGATVLDFFWVQRAPECGNWVTAANSSRLLAWSKEIGELEPDLVTKLSKGSVFGEFRTRWRRRTRRKGFTGLGNRIGWLKDPC